MQQQPQQLADIPSGTILVATDGPYTGQPLKVKGKDPNKPPEADRWIIQTLDETKAWSLPGERLRQVLAAQAKEAEAATQETAMSEPAPPDLPEATEPATGHAEAASVPHEEPAAPPAEAAPTSQEPAPAPAAETPTPPALTFAQVPIKLVIQLWPDEGNGRTAWVGADLPDQHPLLETLSSQEVAELLKSLAKLMGQLEAEFPARQAKIAAALAAEQRTSAATPAKVATTPTTKSTSKTAGRAIKNPLTTVPQGTQATTPNAGTTGLSPERQAFLATLHQTEMFAPAKEAPATTAHA